MEFKERIDEHVKLIKKYKDENFKEEQTKMYLIAPFLNLLLWLNLLQILEIKKEKKLTML